MRKSSKLMAGLLAAMTALASGTSVFAEGRTYTPVSGGNVVLEKYLIMDKEANVPNVTFNYTIAAGAAQDATATNGKVFAGDDANAVTGTPTIGSVTFATGDTTYETAQDLPSTVNTQRMDNGETLNKDKVTLAAGEKYARKDITANLSGVKFKEPGVYRYIITETASGAQGITDDADATRVLDVYVIEDPASANSLKIEGYVLHNNADTAVVPKDGTLPAGKAEGFKNKYTSHDLTLSKTVTGNQGSHDEYFKFTVVISNAVEGTKYDVDLSNADATTKTNGINTTAKTNPASLTVGTGGTVTGEFWLQHGQSIVIKGLADGTKYTIAEDNTAMNNEGYTTSCQITGDADAAFTQATRTAADSTTGIKADTTVPVTNNKAGVIPTGLYQTILPGALFVGVALFGIMMHMKKKAVKA